MKNEESNAKFPHNPFGYYRDRPDRALFLEIRAITWKPHVRIKHVDYQAAAKVESALIKFIIPLLRHFTIFGQENAQNMRR